MDTVLNLFLQLVHEEGEFSRTIYENSLFGSPSKCYAKETSLELQDARPVRDKEEDVPRISRSQLFNFISAVLQNYTIKI